MKQTLLAILLSISSMAVIASETEVIKLDVVITKDGKAVTQLSTSVKDKQSAPLEDYKISTYPSKIKNDKSVSKVEPIAYITGVIGKITPEVGLDGKINATVSFDISETHNAEIKSYEIGNSYSIPVIDSFNSKQTVNIDADNISTVNLGGGYIATIGATKI